MDSPEHHRWARLANYAIGVDSENRRIRAYADQMIVVGLWTIAEQFLGKVYRGFVAFRDSVDENGVNAPYRWDHFVSSYEQLGIDLAALENYANADECRLVNNAIKHDPVVGSRLQALAFFFPHLGKDLEALQLDVQRYVNGVSDFLGSLIEKANESLDPPP
ncbi:hypothetical protein DX914_03380 [Lysobacter silvisoli]|uniref:Uncharacterized protein n=2 Tax=Lysobacter silvisoli TaxID=2293254 RepID=A0A371K2W0_9GAMM|nr:hypothetical protein DX914_03380 [Lysobacter silvisoli]